MKKKATRKGSALPGGEDLAESGHIAQGIEGTRGGEPTREGVLLSNSSTYKGVYTRLGADLGEGKEGDQGTQEKQLLLSRGWISPNECRPMSSRVSE